MVDNSTTPASRHASGTDGQSPRDSAPLVELVDVNKHFGDLHVLKDINLEVRRGEVVVIIGPSGSGKSTLCRTINRLETIDSGTIRVDGKVLPRKARSSPVSAPTSAWSSSPSTSSPTGPSSTT